MNNEKINVRLAWKEVIPGPMDFNTKRKIVFILNDKETDFLEINLETLLDVKVLFGKKELKERICKILDLND